ncbi:LysM peptidoglycan-binding domain-containing protein [Marimonas sp. MJW-29]|uniref:LysM peptidoglycan-binding domain-containing protein n=1 Tax=Sulfitobacter sediminis TaxID=3234186 RepID=A0ABV3RLK6_9RHOB
MTAPSRMDPVKPFIGFDSYVIPETVKSVDRSTFPLPKSGGILATGAIAVLTFTLGVLATLKFAGPTQTETSQATAKPPFAAGTPDALEAAVAAATQDAVMRQLSADLLTPSTTTSTNTDLSATQRDVVLEGLRPKPSFAHLTEEERAAKVREAREIVGRADMSTLREAVLTGNYEVTAREEGNITRLVLEIEDGALTRESIAELLFAAAERGEITLPAGLSTAEGDIDLDTLFFGLVQTSFASDGTEDGATAAREMSRRALAVATAPTGNVEGRQIYLVEPGDSLAFLSLQFYGRPDDYMRIFEANREILSSPDLIKIGQRLTIPIYQ